MISRNSALRATLVVAAIAVAGVAMPSFAVAQDGPPDVVVSEAGAEPRRALRYDLAAMQPQTMVMTMDISMTMGGMMGNQTQVMPRLRMTMPMTDVRTEGEHLVVNYALDGMEALEREGVMPQLVPMMQEALSAIGTMSGSLTLDNRGALIDSTFDLTGADPAVAAQMQSMQDSMQQMTVPLPEEAVGVGARWTVDTQVEASGMSVNQRATYELTALTETTATMSVTLTQSAGSQPIEDPSLPPGMTVTLDSLETTGTGTMQLNFSRLVPTSSMTMSSSMSMSMSDPSGGTMPPMTIVNDMALTIAAE